MSLINRDSFFVNVKLHERIYIEISHENTKMKKIQSLKKHYMKDQAAQQQKYRPNIIKFCIGAFLLIISWAHLQANEAEKIAITSWFQVLYEKMNVIRNNILWSNGNLLQDKYDLERNYKEILSTIQENSCGTNGFFSDLEQTYEKLKKIDIQTYQTQSSIFHQKAIRYMLFIEELCVPHTSNQPHS